MSLVVLSSTSWPALVPCVLNMSSVKWITLLALACYFPVRSLVRIFFRLSTVLQQNATGPDDMLIIYCCVSGYYTSYFALSK